MSIQVNQAVQMSKVSEPPTPAQVDAGLLRIDGFPSVRQEMWRTRCVQRTWAFVRASGPAVRKVVFILRLKAAVAKEAVQKRRRVEAADVITEILRVRKRSACRTSP